MSNAISGPPHRPRPLPAGETLPPEDYRRLFGVMESIDRAPDLPTFREHLIRALQTWFGYQGASVLHGDSLPDAVASGCGVLSGYSQEFLEEYAGGWINLDPYRSERTFQLLMDVGVLRLGELPDEDGFIRDFLRPHGITDKAAMVIDGAPHGVLYVGVAVQDRPRVPERDLTVLRILRRSLAPFAAGHLARYREQRAARAAWRLTPREWDVADLAAQGLTNRQIADRLFIGVDTVKKHLSRVFAETSCASRAQLAARYPTPT